MKVALYARVSTESLDPEGQLAETIEAVLAERDGDISADDEDS